MKGYAVNETNEEKCSVTVAFSDFYRSAVVDGEKEMSCEGEVGESIFES